MAHHAGAAADVAFSDRTSRRAVERSDGAFCGNVKPVDVVETAVGRLGDHRRAPGLKSGPFCLPPQDGVADNADAVGIGDADGAFEEAARGSTWCRSSRRCRST